MEHQPLPVKGYKPQDEKSINLVNEMKRQEETVLQALDALGQIDGGKYVDQRWLAIGRTHIEQAYMAINRSIFRPTRVEL